MTFVDSCSATHTHRSSAGKPREGKNRRENSGEKNSAANERERAKHRTQTNHSRRYQVYRRKRNGNSKIRYHSGSHDQLYSAYEQRRPRFSYRLLTAMMMLFIALFIVFLNPIRCLSCFKCMTSSVGNDTCADPFNPIDNHLEVECQATSKGRNGQFPARFCVKISGVVVDVDRNVNRSLLHRSLYLRTCITDNIMESTRSSDSTGHFRLKNFDHIKGVRMQGTITLCSSDGCNQSTGLLASAPILFASLLVLLTY